jgi:hypothetical protein
MVQSLIMALIASTVERLHDRRAENLRPMRGSGSRRRWVGVERSWEKTGKPTMMQSLLYGQ